MDAVVGINADFRSGWILHFCFVSHLRLVRLSSPQLLILSNDGLHLRVERLEIERGVNNRNTYLGGARTPAKSHLPSPKDFVVIARVVIRMVTVLHHFLGKICVSSAEQGKVHV